MKLITLKKEWILTAAIMLIITGLAIFYVIEGNSLQAGAHPQSGKELAVNLVTGEFKSEMNGKTIEAYRWDPGTIVIPKNEKVTLKIFGINGEEHPFYIEGTDIKGTVQKGKETVVLLHIQRSGTYRLICTAHMDTAHNGPMIAYIVVK